MKEMKDRKSGMATKQIKYKKVGMVIVLFIAAYFFGGGIGILSNAYDKGIIKNEGNWGLGFPVEGQPPVATVTPEELKQYDAYYIGDTDKKLIYLTFDAGYENGYTSTILDALKKNHVPATFFLVGNFMTRSPELVERMVAEGHQVANHTYNHPNMASISSMDAFRKEVEDLESAFENITGEKMIKCYRPPQGKYSESNLKMAKELGYKTFFWSLAYVDWYNDDQPTKEEAFDKLLSRIHPGAIVLLHSTSKTNSEILDELIIKWKDMGYIFGSLDDFK